jgi:hypothetical protein
MLERIRALRHRGAGTRGGSPVIWHHERHRPSAPDGTTKPHHSRTECGASVLRRCARRDSNPRPSAPEAVPASAHQRWPLLFQGLTGASRQPASARDAPVVTIVVTPLYVHHGVWRTMSAAPGAGRVRVAIATPDGDMCTTVAQGRGRGSVQDVRLGMWTMRAVEIQALNEGSQLSLSNGAGERPSPLTA